VLLGDRATALNREAARREIEAQINAFGLVPMRHDYGSGVNVWARLPADAPVATGESVVLGAHYDSVSLSPGANDNATGVAAVLAVARMLSQVCDRRRDLILVLFDEEESGLVGSRAFAGMLGGITAPVHSVHTVDQLGWDEDGDGLVEIELPDADLFSLYEAARDSTGSHAPLLETMTPNTDHAAFRPRYAATGISEGYASGDTTPHIHRSSDTYETVNFEYLGAATLLIVQAMMIAVR
jgi:hypothetical protein